MINQLILGGAPPCMMLLPQKRIPLRIVHGASWTICAVADGSTNTMACRLGQYTLRHEVGGSNLNKLGEVNKENVVRISLMLFCSYTFCSCKMY